MDDRKADGRTFMRRLSRAAAFTAAVLVCLGAGVPHSAANPEAAAGQPPSVAPNGGPAISVEINYLTKQYAEPPPLSLLDKVLTDEGVQGARVALKENNMTGRLLNHTYTLKETIVPAKDDIAPSFKQLLASGQRFFIANLEQPDLLAIADLPEARDAIILNVRASDDELRGANCRANLFHIIPSYAMRADALAQYLLWKKWRQWLLIAGQKPEDLAYAAAIRRAAGRYGAKIVDERVYKYDAGSRRTDSGHQQIQTQMPMLTQGAPQHDVVFVADMSETFGDYLQYRTSVPRPVVGSHGLQALAWHRSFEQYAGTQMQNRFERAANRAMTERDYTAWLGMRVFGEAVTRISKSEAADVRAYMLSKEFGVAGFKGQGMTFRLWDNQMRQPMLLSGARALVSISPQDGFLHQKFLTDTLGYDEPETQCRMTKAN
ncbi:MAG: ABC transporter substrate-binding protein [Hyphomicrobiaceae bacterium]|nr:ABC transporter substrate-binding protein [Hyphomicrobiaceae bacterium]